MLYLQHIFSWARNSLRDSENRVQYPCVGFIRWIKKMVVAWLIARLFGGNMKIYLQFLSIFEVAGSWSWNPSACNTRTGLSYINIVALGDAIRYGSSNHGNDPVLPAYSGHRIWIFNNHTVITYTRSNYGKINGTDVNFLSMTELIRDGVGVGVGVGGWGWGGGGDGGRGFQYNIIIYWMRLCSVI